MTPNLKLIAAAFTLGLAAAAPVLAGETLVMNGATASADVRTLNGSAYVKLSDVAKALGMVLVKRPGGYELTKAGGANQVQGVTQGKVGDVLFDGKWRFQVLSVQKPDSYTMKTPGVEPSSWPRDIIEYSSATRVLKAKPGYQLVVLQCRVTNGVKEKRTLWTASTDKQNNTALTDTEGSSYTPVGYDFEGGPTQSKWLVQGAALSFPILFSVPETAQLKGLIFTLKNNQTDEKANDVRVSL
jgi:hypothetical protein